MKPTEKIEQAPIVIRRYSDHPVVQKKLAEVRKMLEKADLSFLDNPPKKQ
jgi:hypothetical protein